MSWSRSKPANGEFPNYLHKSLDDLEGPWGEPTYDTHIVRSAHALHKKPLINLSDEELRLALSQKIGFPWVLSLTLVRLREDPLRSGMMYEGDVLANALRIPKEVWGSQLSELRQIADTVVPTLDGDEYDTLVGAYLEFIA